MDKKKILLTNKYEGLPYDVLKNAIGEDFYLEMLDSVTQECLERQIADADYLLVSGRLKIDENSISKAEKLKMIQRTGVGLDNMNIDCFKQYGIPLYVNKGVNAQSVAEHTIMLILATLRRVCFVNNQLRDGIWKKQQTGLTTHELYGKTVGIIGMGSIGKLVAEKLQGFFVRILYFDDYRLPNEDEDRLNISFASKEELLKCSDIVSLHCSYNAEVGYVLSEKEFELMKDGSIIINTARGKLIDETALVKYLKNGKLIGCGIDTFEEEPMNFDSELLKFDDAILTSHIAGVTFEAFERMMRSGIDNIKSFDNGYLEDIQFLQVS